ncbi:MAG TPA: Na/Pi symporter [Flavobacteriales bacterium]|nr:Na/Pi symporter [Flavobacteriales bacterium]
MKLTDLWQLLAGLSLFLYGMWLLEDSIKQLAGRTFKLFLQKNTNNKFSALASGTVVTAILQSSSVVTLIVLGFVGAGVLPMSNALAVVFGSNLGTTIDAWVVATLGFKLNIESFALPIIALSGICVIAFEQRKKLHGFARFMLGFGLLFLGLSFMKTSVEDMVHNFDFSRYANNPLITFLLIGFTITAIIQSSSATMVITLTALHSKIIPFEAAVAVITGSELGSAMKILLGSIGGIGAKRRVAVGNIIFNITITLIGYFLMYPIIWLVYAILGKNEPLIGLVLFQSIINICGIVLFLPFLNSFSKFLEKRFKGKEKTSTFYIQDVSRKAPELSIELLEKETHLFIQRVIALNAQAFHLPDSAFNARKDIKEKDEDFNTHAGKYENIKKAEGEILILYGNLGNERTGKEEYTRIAQLINSVRHAMYAGKGIKDIVHNHKDLGESANDASYRHYQFLQKQLGDFYTTLYKLLEPGRTPVQFHDMENLMKQIRRDYENGTNEIYKESEKKTFTELELSTLLNVNREVYSSCKALILSVKDYMLSADEAEKFDSLTVLN